MTDNVSIKDATDATRTIATDEVGGAQVQIVKIGVGGDGEATPVSAADPLPVLLNAVPLAPGAATDAKLDTVLTALAGVATAIANVAAAAATARADAEPATPRPAATAALPR